MTTSIQVDYKHVEGWHVFSSDSLPGLYVASQNAQEAYDDVPTSIEILLKLNAAMTCKVMPELSFTEFMKQQARRDEPSRPPVMESQRYAVQACA